MRTRRHLVVEDEALVVERRQDRLPEGDRIQVVVERSNGVHAVHRSTLAQQTVAVEYVPKVRVLHVAGDSLGRPLL